MKKNGRPLVVLTDEQNYKIEALAAVLTQEQIADYLGIGRTTFYEIMKRDPKVLEHYKKGKSDAILDVGQNLITQARLGNTSAAIFYLKTQAGWKEPEQEKQETSQPLTIIIKKDD